MDHALLKDARPDVAAEIVDRSLLETLTAASGRKVEWRCPKCGGVYVAVVRNRTARRATGCPYCAGRKVLRGFNDLRTTDPDVAALCDDPHDAVTHVRKSHDRIAWRCPKCGRTWEATVANVVSGTRCPYCSPRGGKASDAPRPKAGRKPRSRPLSEVRPDLAAELADLDDVPSGTHDRVWWVCSKDPRHTWQASVVSRVRGAGCPFCAGQRAVPGIDDVVTLKPKVARLLVDPAEAAGLTVGSGRRCHFRCPEGHAWEAPVRDVVRATDAGRTGCPVCSKHASNRGHRPTVADARPDLLAEAADPDEVGRLTLGSGRSVRWVCRRHGEPYVYEMPVRNRVRGQGCPVCGHHAVVAGVNDLATTHPALAAELVDPSMATEVSRGSERVCQWRCAKGHVWEAPVYARVAGNGCPTCSNQSTSAKEQKLADVVATLCPDVRRNVRIENPDTAGGHALEVDVVADGLGIEFNGTFWHSEAAGRGRGDHSRKVAAMLAAGLSPHFVWEDEWDDARRRAIAVSSIAYRLHATDRLRDAFDAAGIADLFDDALVARHGARSLVPGPATQAEADAFLDATHIQGRVTATRHLALRDAGGRIWAVMSLRSPEMRARQHGRHGQWEIVRYATLGSVPGGFTRLLAYGKSTLGASVTSWLTFSDRCVSDGALYESCGFHDAGRTAPSYWYTGGIVSGGRASKESFQLRRFKDDPRLEYEGGWTESEAARANGLSRVWDAGKVRWEREA